MKCNKCNSHLEFWTVSKKYYCPKCKKHTVSYHTENIPWSTHFREANTKKNQRLDKKSTVQS